MQNGSGLEDQSGTSDDWTGFALGDYDGDGNLDVFVTAKQQSSMGISNLLFKGNGVGFFDYVSGTILNQTQQGQSALWFDYGGDGTLELFVKNYFGEEGTCSPTSGKGNLLYSYDAGSDSFSQIYNSGLDCATEFPDDDFGHGENCSFQDFNNDRHMDVVFSRTKSHSTRMMPLRSRRTVS